MKITNYNVQSKSGHRSEKSKEVSQRLEAWKKGSAGNKEDTSFLLDIEASQKTFVLSKKQDLTTVDDKDIEKQNTDVKLKLIESFIYITTGKHVRLKAPELDSGSANVISGEMTAWAERDDWGLLYEYHEVSSASESVNFTSVGSVQTSDGRNIAFELDFNMSGSYYEENDISVRMGNAIQVDPLTIALDNNAPKLTKSKFAFDLNSDGKTENISFASQNSGFLALDKNEDGEINDGTELFGPQSGDGFAELRAYDADHNGWIDESDAVFGKLSILTVSENGEKTLFKLGDAGIGAIYLNDVKTPFEMKNGKDTLGEMKSSSIYIRENGTAGTIHQIDLNI